MISFRDYEMDSERQRFLPFLPHRRRVFGTAVYHYAKLIGAFQPAPEVQGGNVALSDDFKMIIIVTPYDNISHLFVLQNDNYRFS